MSEIDRTRSRIMKNRKIQTMSHKVWQTFDFLILKNLKFIIVNILQKRISVELLKLYFESYRNSCFLIDKKIKNKYWMINVVMNMNEVIIRDINLLFNTEKFSKKLNLRKCALFSWLISFSNTIKWYWSRSLEIWLRSWLF